MAYKARINDQMSKTNPNLKRILHLYNIDKPVGQGCVNKREDVMLIQFMLKTEDTAFRGGAAVGNNIYGDVPMHGTLNLTTLGYLLMFQMRSREYGAPSGCIEPMDLNHLQTAGGYLAKLNANIMGNKADVFRDFSVAPGIPGALVPLLKGFD